GDAGDDFILPDVPDHPQQQLLAWEKELLNLYLSAHPLAHVAAVLKKRVKTFTSALTEEWAGQRVTLGGRITEVRRIMTKKGDAMAAVQLEDMQGAIEVVVFPKTYAATADRWQQDAIVLVTGTVSTRNDEPQLVADEVEVFEVSDDELNHRDYLLRIRLTRSANDSIELARLDQVFTALNRYPGDDRFELLVRNGHWEARLTQAPGGQGIKYCPELMSRLEEILGPNTVEPVPVPVAARM
ncbi:MAG TPA: OB-fold nucleic acid binding domain-containing protein, partial [Ktedonobacterales bacterium]|nr:OB-fold nucleic acid binding domain-containing protein [Ktedonobacterales bacterium]